MDWVRFHARLHPVSPAISDLTFDRQWSYAEFDRLIASCVAVLLAGGVDQGDRIACLSKNRAEIIVLHIASARIGAIFVPLNWRLTATELDTIISDCDPALVFGDEMAAIAGVEAQRIGSIYDQCASTPPTWPDQMPQDLPSLMLYTSGTTGSPKGVLLSERNLAELAINSALLCEVDAHSSFLCESPMFHIIGMATSVRTPILKGARILVSNRFEPERTLARLSDPELRITHYFCVPQMAAAIRAADGFDASKLKGLKAIFTGGAPHAEAQIRDWLADDISIVDGFGMSEAGTVFGMPLDRRLIHKKAGSVGIPTPRVQARLVDDDNVSVARNMPGELQLKGDNIAVGYWRNEAGFRRSFTEDGWFRTGDILAVDDDGYFRVTGRKKDMYISGGENVYPAEIEAQLVEFPGIREFAVVGVPDAKWGEVGCLFYSREGDEISVDDIIAFLTPRIAQYKIPKKFCAINKLPRNGVGKLMRHELRNMYRAG